MDQKARSDITKNAAGSLKKILSSGGSLKGAFYFAADSKLKDASVVIYLAAKGAKATSVGKKLRKSIPGARFARGVVDVHKSRPLFVIHGGNASPELLKKACKTVLSKQDGLRFLSRALARLADAETEEDELSETSEEQAEIAASLELTEAEQAELDQLTEELSSDEMAQTAEELFKSFLSAEASAQELAELNAERLAAVERCEHALEEAPKPSEAWTAAYDALREARFALAETNYAGPDPFPDVGDELAPDAAAVLGAAIEGTMRFLQAQFRALEARLLELERQLSSGEISEAEIRDERQRLDATATSYQRQLSALQEDLAST